MLTFLSGLNHFKAYKRPIQKTGFNFQELRNANIRNF